jgi:hypothetical protein
MTEWDMPQHSYEEIREAVIDILMNRSNSGDMPRQFSTLVDKVRFVFGQRSARLGLIFDPARPPQMHPYDAEFVREVFWDLFRQGFITLGMDSSNNAGWPWFKLSHFGKEALQSQSPFRFHNRESFLSMIKAEVPDISANALIYLDEAVAAFYAECLLASSVMLGVASEAEFLHLLDVACANTTHGATFAPIQRKPFIRTQIIEFRKLIKPLIPLLPKNATEDLETNLDMIQSVLRIARNDAGHPSKMAPLRREQVYVWLQLFMPFARQLMRLRVALA